MSEAPATKALTPPCRGLGPFQDAVLTVALARIGEAADRVIHLVAEHYDVEPDMLREWIAQDAVARMGWRSGE